MSSSRLSYNRKRRSDYETSESGSEDEYTPVRKIRKCRRETSIKQSFASRCRNLWQWISDLPLKDYFKETMYKKSLIYPQPTDVVVIDDDEDVIPVENEDDDDDDIAVVYETKDRSPSQSPKYRETRQDSFLKSLSTDTIYSLSHKNKSRYKVSELGSVRRPFNGSNPLSSSTPFERGNRPVMDPSYSNSVRKHLNGFHGNDWGVKNDLRDESAIPKSNSKRLISPITNPAVDVEILLDSNGTVDDSDDLEIISEVPKTSRSAQPPKVRATYKLSRSLGDRAASSQDRRMNGTSNSDRAAENGHSSMTSYTAHEVVRLQEKAQYQLLLDKLVKDSIYRPAYKTSSRSAQVQVDLEDSDDDEPMIRSPFKREVLKQPVTDFLKKYYKPCALRENPPQDQNSHLQIAYEALGKDEDVRVVDVKPLPEYRRRPKPRSDFFSPDWIQELKMTISSETEKRLQIVAEQEQKIERFRSRRDAKIAEENRLRDELMNVMLPRVKVEKEDEFPALTSDMNNVIDAAFDSTPGQVFSNINRTDITHSDIITLNGLSWLNDNIINSYLQLIVERSKLDNFPTVYAFNTYFYTSLKTRGENNVLRWTRKVDIFSFDILLVPLHLGMHWALAIVDNRSKKIQYYDSMRGNDNTCLYDLQRYLIVEMKDKKKTVIDSNYFSLEAMKDIPQQMNGSDCGMFTLKYAEYISRDAPITFTQENMQYFRRKMVYELVTAQLL